VKVLVRAVLLGVPILRGPAQRY